MSTEATAQPAGHAPDDHSATEDHSAEQQTADPANLRRQIVQVVVGIAVPAALYYVFHSIGLSNFTALLLAAILPSLSTAYNLVFRHQVDGISLVVVATIVLTAILSAIAHDPRFLLARDGFITAMWGLWFFASMRSRRPAAFLFARPLMEGRRWLGTRAWEPLWETSPQFRRIWRFATIVFGTGLLADAVIRVVMAYSLPISVVPALGSALWPVTFVLIQVITNIYYHRAGLYRLLGASWATRG